jgi:hypothetical protein
MSKWLQTFFDVTARKPSGWLGKLLYQKPVGHYGFFHVAIEITTPARIHAIQIGL